MVCIQQLKVHCCAPGWSLAEQVKTHSGAADCMLDDDDDDDDDDDG